MKIARFIADAFRGREPPAGMALIAGGTFWMGSDGHYVEERPSHKVTVGGFYLDVGPVTNAEFAKFVEATGHQTLAERKPNREDYPDADPKLLKAGSSLFVGTRHAVPLDQPSRWWAYRPGASWKHPEGPGSSIADRMDHPVVHVAYQDACAYAAWLGKRLATEAEWEYAARGGLDRAEYAWGSSLQPSGRQMANYWIGDFPWRRDTEGYGRTSPVGRFPADRYGLFDMIGNVWEWTSDEFKAHGTSKSRCCGPDAGGGRTPQRQPFPLKVLKGGSHLCAESYCRRYRPAARHPQSVDTSTSHIGFRCAMDLAT